MFEISEKYQIQNLKHQIHISRIQIHLRFESTAAVGRKCEIWVKWVRFRREGHLEPWKFSPHVKSL